MKKYSLILLLIILFPIFRVKAISVGDEIAGVDGVVRVTETKVCRYIAKYTERTRGLFRTTETTTQTSLYLDMYKGVLVADGTSRNTGWTIYDWHNDYGDVTILDYHKVVENCPSYIKGGESSGTINITIPNEGECSSDDEFCIRLANLETGARTIQTCHTANYDYIQECGCMPAALTDLTSRLYMLIKIATPALLLIIGGFELIKAMSAQDEKAIKKAQEKLLKKFVAAVAVFLIFTAVQLLVGVISSDSEGTMTCIDYILNGYVA